MKKARVFAVVLCLVMLLSCLTACSTDKKALTAEGFTKIMEENGFEVNDISAVTDASQKYSIIAVCDDFQVEYYEFIDEDTCKDTFDSLKKDLKEENPVQKNCIETNAKNHSYIAFESGGEFFVVSRIGSTLVYCGDDDKYQADILEIVKTLGYR